MLEMGARVVTIYSNCRCLLWGCPQHEEGVGQSPESLGPILNVSQR